jgi:hypothetical protein
MSDDIRLDLLRDAICRSDLDGQTKDALADDLKYAQDINGTEDEALRGIKRLLISGVRRELLAHDRVAMAIENHVAGCSARATPKTIKDAIQQIIAQYPILIAIMILLAVKEYGIGWIGKLLGF